MKKIAKLVIGLSVLTMLMVCMTAVSFAGTAGDRVTVSFKAAIPGGVDYVKDEMDVTGDLFETYFPDFADKDTVEKVSYADALVAAHIEKYGKDSVKDHLAFAEMWGTLGVAKQFDHEYVGFYYQNGVSCPKVAAETEIKDNDELFAGSYKDYNYSDLYASFDKREVVTTKGQEVSLLLAAENEGTGVVPKSAKIYTVDPVTFEVDELEGATYENGLVKVTFANRGIYLIIADGEVEYTPYWDPENTHTGGYAGAFCKVYVDIDTEKKAELSFTAAIPGSFDTIEEEMTVKADLFETYFPEYSTYETISDVSYADALVAAHVDKYGEKYVKDHLAFAVMWGTLGVAKQFDHEYVGFYYQNGAACPKVAVEQPVADKDVLFTGSYVDFNYADLYSYFDKTAVSAKTGQKIKLTINCENEGTGVAPESAVAATVNANTGAMKAISGSTYENGVLTFSFTKSGTYYVSATGTVKYTPSWDPENVHTGAFAGALCKVTVKDATPAKPVIKTAKRNSKVKGTVTWKKAANAKKYEVAYKAKGAKKWTTKKTTKLKVTLKLKAKKAYQVKVRSINGSAKSAYSKVKTIKAK